MVAKSSKMYKDSPRLGKDEKGEVVVETPVSEEPSEADKVQAGVDGIVVKQSSDRTEAVHRHISERLQMHHKNEAMYGMGKSDSAANLEELKAMHKRHEAEFKTLYARHEKGAE